MSAPSSTTELWFDPSFGASGDMLLGAFFGLGVDVKQIVSELEKLGLEDWSVDATTASRCGVMASRALVETKPSHHGRTWTTIDAILADANLPETVKSGARKTFRRLGEIEAAQHGVSIDEIHFHEVGAVDAILDITGAWLCWHLLGEPLVSCGPIGIGHGTVNAAHGQLPLPAPATAALLVGHPIRSMDVASETITPTGAALLVTMPSRWGTIPTGTITKLARGAGGRNPESYPNVVTAYLVETAPAPTSGQVSDNGATIETKTLLATNIDDATGEVIAYTIDRLLAAGADDAWATPIVMKKGRPAIGLSVLCSPADVAALTELVMRETGSLGVRQSTMSRAASPRTMTEVVIDGHTIRIKIGPHRAKPEHDDLVAAAKATQRPLRDVAAAALKQLSD